MLRNVVDYPYHLQSGPHSYLYDVDPTFNHSIEILYHSGLRGRILDALSSEPPTQMLPDAIFDKTYLDGIVQLYREGTEVRGAQLSDLSSLVFLAQRGWCR